MGHSLIDPERSVVVERGPKPRIETAFVRKMATDLPAPSRFPTGSGRFGDAKPGVVKRLASDAIVEFSPAYTHPLTPTVRYEARAKAPRIGLLAVLAVGFGIAVAFVTWTVLRFIA